MEHDALELKINQLVIDTALIQQTLKRVVPLIEKHDLAYVKAQGQMTLISWAVSALAVALTWLGFRPHN